MAEAFDTRYVYAVGCTWHAPIQQAGTVRRAVPRPLEGEHTVPSCPHCGSALMETPTPEEFWEMVRSSSRKDFPEYEQMMRWSEGKCFPDFFTMQDAYRQAKEE